jgi:ABC-type metal ion transport system, periplasmic component/surface adhesin
MKKYSYSAVIVFGCFLLFTGILSGCGRPDASVTGGGRIQVVAAEDFYGETAKAVGAKYVTVTSVINKPGMDPHDYEPTIATARAVSRAQLVISNGLGYDGWMDPLVQSGQKKVWIRIGEDLMHLKDGANEHLWYYPDTMPRLAGELAAKLGKIDPNHAALFKENAQKYVKSIKQVKDEIAGLRKKSGGKPVDVSEPVFDYTLKALGYKVTNNHFALAVDQGTDPSPRDIAAMEADIKNHRIAFFVLNTQNTDPVVQKMVARSKQNHVPVVNVTETLPRGKSYQTWMLDELRQVERVQKGQP